ncbi:aldehyde reductase [Luteibacter pinisoli]|uniref:Aldehyde reductase n=1 Tax=Luteibacter pinisoli TaxID=2589080 RepID=A0A4Y5Z2H5_9GAMM|nr:aldehyde reductase [Luteibacter pinisoli]QDE39570.1 aldehyde reductase [Luteibacter pinisoli]
MANERVLVTGGTGFIAQHCMVALIERGFTVRTTVRTLSRETEVRDHLRTAGVDAGDRLSFIRADLSEDAGWADAVAGCAYVVHGASPTPSGDQVTEADWVRPAVDGNLRVLRAARGAGVKRVVLTSAFGAIGAGHKASHRRPFDETDWSDISGNVWLYQKSKTLAERAAWEFIAGEGQGMELAAVNPTAVMGPVLGADYSHSIRLIKNLLEGQQGVPRINSGFVDVRDVADLHVRAMLDPAAAGERFVATAGESLWIADVARILRERVGPAAARVTSKVLPNWIVRMAAKSNPAMRSTLPLLGMDLNVTAAKAERLLGWKPRSREDAIVATAESLIRLGLVS